MGNVVQMRRKVKIAPLKATYDPAMPYVVERDDDDGGGITYDVVDTRPDSYRLICCVPWSGNAKHDAEQIARALNMAVSLGKDSIPKMKRK